MVSIFVASVVMVVDETNAPPNVTLPFMVVKPLVAERRIDAAGVEDTPLTVDTRLPLVVVKVLVPTMVASVVAATPFMVVLTVFTVGLETMVVFIIGTLAPVALFTVVVKPFPVEVFETEVAVVFGS